MSEARERAEAFIEKLEESGELYYWQRAAKQQSLTETAKMLREDFQQNYTLVAQLLKDEKRFDGVFKCPFEPIEKLLNEPDEV